MVRGGRAEALVSRSDVSFRSFVRYGLLVTYHDKLCVLCLVLVLVPVSVEMDGG